MNKHVKWGANYTPREGWFHAWSNPDFSSIKNDFQALTNLGLDHVRIFPLWPILQPNRTLIDTHAIGNVLTMVDTAKEAGLNVSVDLLQGHLSSFDYLPAWVSTWHRRNIFTDPDVIEGQKELGRILAKELSQREHVLGMTLGNEIGQFAAPRHPDQFVTSTNEAYSWTKNLLETIRGEFPNGSHQHCFDDDLWFVDDHPFTPQAAVELGDETTVHSWIFGGAAQKYGVDVKETEHFGRYVLEIADMWQRAFGVGENRTVWLQEIGAPTPWITAENAPEFAVNSAKAALGYEKLSAITWWCSHDVSRKLADFPELEYTLGLIDSDGNPKPIGEALSALIAETRAGEVGVGTGAESKKAVQKVEGLRLDGSNRSLTSTKSAAFEEWISAAMSGEYRSLELVEPESE